MLDAAIEALGIIFTPTGMLLLVAGGVLALVLGMLPGLSSTEAMLIILPFTYSMTLANSMIVLNSAYATAFVGGAVTSILFGIPGSSMNVATIFDGYPMRKQGRAFYAIGAASSASMLGGVASIILVILLMPMMVPFSLLFGPPEWFAFILFGMIMMCMSGESTILRTLISGMLGVIAASIGLSTVTGELRFAFGSTFLWGGINIIPAFIGLYPFAEVIDITTASKLDDTNEMPMAGSMKECFFQMWVGFGAAAKKVRVLSFSSFIGWFIGVIPGVGGTLANMMGYILVKRTSRHPETFGKGELEGLVGAEAANNASVGGAMVPCLALGIPGSLNTAILLGIMMIHGIQPGTNMFGSNRVMTLVVLLTVAIATIFGSAVVLICGWPIARMVNRLDMKRLVPPIIFISLAATMLARNNENDLIVALVMGLIGYGMKKFGFSRICFVIALMLNPILESSFFQSLSISRGSYTVFFTRPVTIIIWAITIAMVLLVVISGRKARQAEAESVGAKEEDA